MKGIKIILTVIAIVFAGLSLMKILPFDIAQPIMLTLLATLFLLRGMEDKKRGDKNGFLFMLILAILEYAVAIRLLFIG